MRRNPIPFLLAALFALPATAMADATHTDAELSTDDTALVEVDAAAAPAAENEPAESALDTFKKAHETVLLYVRSKVKSELIQAEADKLLDYDYLGRSALGGKNRAEKRCEPRCAEYETLLARLIRENYLKRIAQADQGKVEYLGEEKRPKASKVTTRVTWTKDGVEQKVEVAYVMRHDNGRWQVVDIITDGVSLAKNYRYEFNKILRDEGGIDGLIKRLETKLADIAKAE